MTKIDIPAEAREIAKKVAVTMWREGKGEVYPSVATAELIADLAIRVRAEQKKRDEGYAASVAHEDPEFESEPPLVIKGVELAGRKIEGLIRNGK